MSLEKTSNIQGVIDRKKSYTLIKLLALIIGISGPFTGNLYLPSLPAMSYSFGVPHNLIQLTITVYLLGFALFQLIYGPCSDRFGRRKIALIGLSIAFISTLGCLSATTINTLILFRLLQGAGMAATVTLMRSIMRDIFSGTQLAKAVSHISIVFAIVPSIAPVMGGYVQEWYGWRVNFFIIFVVISITLITTLLWLPETHKTPNPAATKIHEVLKNYSTLLRNRIFMGYLICSSCAVAGIISYTTAAPILFQHILGMSPSEFGWLSIYIAGSVAASRFLNSILIEKINMNNMLITCISLMLASGLSMLIIGSFGIINISVVLIPAIVFIVGAGTIMPNATAGALTPFGHMAGSAAALYGTIQMLISFLMSGVVALSPEHNQLPLASILTALAGVALLGYYFLIHPKSLA